MLGGEYNMPRRDGTGPLGLGQMTGRGFGPCGLGRYFAWNWPQSKQDQLQALKEYKQFLKEELEDVEKEEKELEEAREVK